MLSDPSCDRYGVQAIAALCGYMDYPAFFRAYRRLYGETPTGSRVSSR